MLRHECSAALEFMKRRPLDSSCHAAHAYPSHPNSEIDHDPPPLMNEAASLIIVSVHILSPARRKKKTSDPLFGHNTFSSLLMVTCIKAINLDI
jgi:hypothetical protein